MRQLRLLIIAIATICVLALGVFALVNRSAISPSGGDDIIIKGGSLEIQCGANQGTDCLGVNDTTGKYKAKQAGKHVTRVVVKDSNGLTVFDSSALPTFGSKPEIDITYK
jgi:hypothetical protein